MDMANTYHIASTGTETSTSTRVLEHADACRCMQMHDKHLAKIFRDDTNNLLALVIADHISTKEQLFDLSSARWQLSIYLFVHQIKLF